MRRFLCALLCACTTLLAHAFADDLCYDKDTNRLFNCIQKYSPCIPLNESQACKTQLATHAIDALNRQKSMRSMIHTDVTFYMAQAVGIPYDNAHAIAMYNQNLDIEGYLPTNWLGNPIVDPAACETSKPPANCRYLPKPMNGLLRLNMKTGGTFFHYGALYDPKENPNGLNPPLEGSDSEVMLANLYDWVYQERLICTAGLIDVAGCKNSTPTSPSRIIGYMPVLEHSDAQDFLINVDVKNQIIHQDDTHTIYSNNLDSWIDPAQVSDAKMGVYLHMLQDRISHHACIDAAVIQNSAANPSGNHLVTFEREPCNQGIHLLWHSWETGQRQNEVPKAHRSLRPGLEKTYDALLEYAKFRYTPDPRAYDPVYRTFIIDAMMHALQFDNPEQRLHMFITNMDGLDFKPMPGYQH